MGMKVFIGVSHFHINLVGNGAIKLTRAEIIK
jgi:hypothetical protein